eukprot:g128.t1
MDHSSPRQVWCRVPDDEGSWQLNEVSQWEDGKITTADGQHFEEGPGVHAFDPCHAKDFANIADMDDMHEAPLLHLLQRRFAADDIYTFTGDILISLNPYKRIDGLYDMPASADAIVVAVAGAGAGKGAGAGAGAGADGDVNPFSKQNYVTSSGAIAPAPPPHLYRVAERAYASLVARAGAGAGVTAALGARRKAGGIDQAMLVCGESGAGKTEASKYIMSYLALLSHRAHEAAADGTSASGAEASGGPGTSHALTADIEARVLQSSPVLEAFGNAKTVRNNNSSRFGKWIKLHYNSTHSIFGASIQHFLLEKARLVHQAQGERSFHIFYQLCAASAASTAPASSDAEDTGDAEATATAAATAAAAAATGTEQLPAKVRPGASMYDGVALALGYRLAPEARSGAGADVGADDAGEAAGMAALGADEVAQLRLPSGGAAQLNYLSGGRAAVIRGVDDCAEFEVVRGALRDLGIGVEEQAKLWPLLSGVVALGNVKFEPHAGDNGEEARLHDEQGEGEVAHLLGLEPELLKEALCRRSLTAARRQSIHTIPLTVTQAEDSRDALAKYAYSTIFDWLVERINASLGTVHPGSPMSAAASPALGALPDDDEEGELLGAADDIRSSRFIGILDIFGFEILDSNSFEQLCINFANEVLQKQFNHAVFIKEQELYVAEGIDWTRLEFRDNQGVIDLIAKPPSGLFSLMDDQYKLGAPDDTRLLAAMHKTHASNASYNTPQFRGDFFIVQHFAGPVQYTIDGFLAKNKDTLVQDLREVLHGSESPLLSSIFVVLAKREAASIAEAAKQGLKSGRSAEVQFDAATDLQPLCMKRVKGGFLGAGLKRMPMLLTSEPRLLAIDVDAQDTISLPLVASTKMIVHSNHAFVITTGKGTEEEEDHEFETVVGEIDAVVLHQLIEHIAKLWADGGGAISLRESRTLSFVPRAKSSEDSTLGAAQMVADFRQRGRVSGPRIKLQGYLTKRALKSKMNWRKRWFVLMGTELLYFKNASDREPKGRVDLSGPVQVKADDDIRLNCVRIATLDHGEMIVQAESDEDKTRWLGALQETVARTQVARQVKKVQQQADQGTQREKHIEEVD